MYRLGLNQMKSNNYMFFDFEAPLCLSVERNTGVVERLTPSILSAIKSGTLILLEGTLPVKEKDKGKTPFQADPVQKDPVKEEESDGMSSSKASKPEPEQKEEVKEEEVETILPEVEEKPEEDEEEDEEEPEVKEAPKKVVKKAPAKRRPSKAKTE